MEARGFLTRAGEHVYLTPYDDNATSGIVLTSDLSLDGWLESGAATSLLPIADTDGSGGIAALWISRVARSRRSGCTWEWVVACTGWRRSFSRSGRPDRRTLCHLDEE